MACPRSPSEPIAVVGSSCRFAAGLTSPDKLEHFLATPSDLSRPVPAGRFSIVGFSNEAAEYPGTTNSPKAYWLEQDHRAFDASFFNITPKEAEAIDPQQRLLLEVTYEALESAGYTLHRYAGHNVAVFVGVMTGDYDTLSARDDLNASQYTATGSARSIIANRLSYFFDFHGPSMIIDTACSASLVALHQAVQSVRSGESPMACVAGVNIMLTPEQFIAESNLHMLSPTGHSRMWDAQADGYARGEGVAAFFVKTLSRALADGDSVQAIIRDTGVNSDGRTPGITMPNPVAQKELIQQTYRKSGLDPTNPEHMPQFFEAHGTGTPVGDPLEARAISEAFFGETLFDNSADHIPDSHRSAPKMLVGSVKTVIGHTEGAAGLAGVLKVIRSMQHGCIFPNLHLDSLNPRVEPFCGDLRIPTRAMPWPILQRGQVRRASVNSFGFGGTNAHAIIERYDPEVHNLMAQAFDHVPRLIPSECLSNKKFPPDCDVTLPLVLSAASPKSLLDTLARYKDFLHTEQPVCPYSKLCWYLYHHRTSFPYRVAIVAADKALACDAIDNKILAVKKLLGAENSTNIRAKQSFTGPKLLGIFTGQGAQYASMSSDLFHISSVYRETIKRLDTILQTCPDPPAWSIQTQLLASKDASQIGIAAVSQPLCTALQIALVDFLRSVGVRFHCVVGHSSGEIAAAYAAERITDRDAILIAYYRGRCAHLASGKGGQKGAMFACGFSKDEAEDFCHLPEFKGRICVAANNSPSLVTLSGDVDAVMSALGVLKGQGIFARQLNVDTAYHSPHMLRPGRQYVSSLSACGLDIISTSSDVVFVSSVFGDGERVYADKLDPQYWADNMTRPVLFYEAVQSAMKKCGPFHCAIEVGPHPVLKSSVVETMKDNDGISVLYTSVLDRNRASHLAVADFLGTMWSRFDPSFVDMLSYVKNSPIAHVVENPVLYTPPYAWDHTKIYWRESRVSEQYHFRKHPPHELLGVRTRDDDQYQLRWRNILKLDNLPWLDGHKFQGQALLPASAYCIMAVDAARVLLDDRAATIVELQDLELLSGISLEPDSKGVETLFTLSRLPSAQVVQGQVTTIAAEFTLTSVQVRSFGFTPMRKNFQGKMEISLEGSGCQCLPIQGTKFRAETLPVNIDAFYRMMHGIGLEYTGPFRALKSLDRRLNYATATLDCLHAADSTGLLISPATLDTCFQATFATFSSPGDKALWTSFLPTKIGKIRFNLAAIDFSNKHSEIVVETHLTNVEPFSKMGAATITADVSIFDAPGETQIQVQDLIVSSFAVAKPEDDYELYLHTVLDLDPEDEIVLSTQNHVRQPERGLVESCERVARHFASQQRHRVVLEDTPPASPIMEASPGDNVSECPSSLRHSTTQELEMDQFIVKSPYHHTLELIRFVGQRVPEAVPRIMPLIIQEAQQFLNFQKHLGRVVQQMAHRYSRMKILDLTDPIARLTEHILNGLQEAYQLYTIGNETQQNVYDRMPSLKANKKLSCAIIDLSPRDLDGAPTRELYDLVVLSSSAFGTGPLDRLFALRQVRKLMKSGCFLILIDLSFNTTSEQLETYTLPSEAPDAPISTDWADCLYAMTKCGLVSRSRNADQHFPPRFSLSVRQAESDPENEAFDPRITQSTDDVLAEHLLLIGGRTQKVDRISNRLERLLDPKCRTIASAKQLDCVAPPPAAACTSVVILIDLEEPVCTSMTASRLKALKSLLRPGVVILWVTSNARGYPEKAASFGLTRTIKAEIPGLILQVLDLDEEDDSCDIIVNTFCRLARCAQHSPRAESRTLLWSDEPEIHIENGKRLVPRVLPYRPAIERLNASRRPISKTVNTLDTCVLVQPASRGGTGHGRYTAEVVGDATWFLDESPAHHLMYVEYSSSYPTYVEGIGQTYVCAGRTSPRSDFLGVALSPRLQSVVQAHRLLTHDISTFGCDLSRLVTTLAHVLSAIDLVARTKKKNLVLIEPEAALLRCVEVLRCDSMAEEETRLQVWTCEGKLSYQDTRSRITNINPWSSAREVSCYLPLDSVVYDFLPEGSQLSKTLSGLDSVDVTYRKAFDSQTGERSTPSPICKPTPEAKSTWNKALKLSLEDFRQRPLSEQSWSVISTAQLGDPDFHVPPNSVIDWQTDRNVEVEVKPLVNPGMLREDKTYLLVGLTRDMGQSICRLFIKHGARNIVVASRSADETQAWVAELNSAGARILVKRLDVTVIDDVNRFHQDIFSADAGMPPVGGVVNGAMVLEDRVFAQMDIGTWTRVMAPKTVGSKNLDMVFGWADLQFFIMTSSFAAIGGHAGQSNYAAANMYMNGLAMDRRRRGLVGSVLNIGVIYGLGLLARERQDIYGGLERDGYPPVSERDIHHMFIEAIEAGRPVPGQIPDLTTGLARYQIDDPSPQHWHLDQRFCHFALRDDNEQQAQQQESDHNRSARDLVKLAESVGAVAEILQASLCRRMETILQLPANSIKPDSRIVEMGIDSLAAVEIRYWFYKSVGRDVAVMKILAASSISELCNDIAEKELADRGVGKED